MTETYKLGKTLDSYNYQEVQNGILEKGSDAVLDMTDCEYISSTGLRVLLFSKKTADSKGLTFNLIGVGAKVKDVMDITGFGNLFDYA